MSKTAVWWIRRDLRLEDNQALHAALSNNEQIIPLFILDPFFDRSPYVGERRRAFLYDGLRQLDDDLRQKGSRLHVRKGEPTAVLSHLLAESGATAIFAEADHTRYARRRDEAVAADLPLSLIGSTAIRPPGTVLKSDGDPYVVYTPFRNTWKGHPLPRRASLLPAPKKLETPDDLESDDLPKTITLADDVPFQAGEQEANRLLQAFLDDGIYHYDTQRDRVDLDGTSSLSPYLRLGMLSPRKAAVSAIEAISKPPNKKGRENAQVWLDELIWRDFYIHIVHFFPHVLGNNFRSKYDALEWRNDEEAFKAWCAGQTGYPIVDAAMRQMNETGWMHNRARMIVASFLVKDLLIDWRWGERYFMQQLVDGDPAANNGGWQWSAGTGTDAAPYFRIFNPISQSKKFDPDGSYIHRWVPELRDVTSKKLHEPWTMSPAEQRKSGCIVGEDYPQPMVDHKEARQRTLAAYKATKS